MLTLRFVPSLLLACVLPACGGGGGSSKVTIAPGATVGNETIATALVEAIAPSDIQLPELRPRVATFGLPFAQGEITFFDGRPRLGLQNADVWQFRALDTWPDGSVRWVLVDVLADVGRNAPPVVVNLATGPGLSDQREIISDEGSHFLIDTGPLRARVSKQDFNLFDRVVVDGILLVRDGKSRGLIGRTANGQTLVRGPTQVSVEHNGPARAMLRADGVMTDASGNEVVDFTCRIEGTAESRDLDVTLTVRNAGIGRPQHTRIGGLELHVDIDHGDDPVARFAHPVEEASMPLPPGSCAHIHQAFASSDTRGVLGDGPNYKPHIPKLDGQTLADEGFRLQLNGETLFEGDRDAWPRHGYVDLSGSIGGATIVIRHMPYFWPAALEANGKGDMVAGLFTHRNPFGYTFVWRQHESRTATFSFHGPSGAEPDPPIEVARRTDTAVAGRYGEYLDYDAAGVFPFDLVTPDEQEAVYTLLGLDHQVIVPNDDMSVMRFLPAGQTGGFNNHAVIQKDLADVYLRFGRGGPYLQALDLALYKSEWQILRSDDFHHDDDPGAINDESEHSMAFKADLEHRYREGIALAYHLTGDERLREALLDEAEILPGLSITAQERSMYQTLRAHTVVGRFVRDRPELRAPIDASLRQRLEYILFPTIDVNSDSSGFGWDGPPGMGTRGYFVNSTQNNSEKPPGENFQTRGWISATLGPMAYYLCADYLGSDDPLSVIASKRLQDLAFWTANELHPLFPDPGDRRIALSYAVTLQEITAFPSSDFHSILLAQAEAWRQTRDHCFLEKGAEQLEAFYAHDTLHQLDTRLENQHYIRALLDFLSED